MAKYSKKNNQTSDKTQQEAERLAKGIQKPGQTKDQTKLIAQGIAKGIELYKKQQKAKTRELDKAQKKASKEKSVTQQEIIEEQADNHSSSTKLPWILLLLSWIGFGAYLAVVNA